MGPSSTTKANKSVSLSKEFHIIKFGEREREKGSGRRVRLHRHTIFAHIVSWLVSISRLFSPSLSNVHQKVINIDTPTSFRPKQTEVWSACVNAKSSPLRWIKILHDIFEKRAKWKEPYLFYLFNNSHYSHTTGQRFQSIFHQSRFAFWRQFRQTCDTRADTHRTFPLKIKNHFLLSLTLTIPYAIIASQSHASIFYSSKNNLPSGCTSKNCFHPTFTQKRTQRMVRFYTDSPLCDVPHHPSTFQRSLS